MLKNVLLVKSAVFLVNRIQEIISSYHFKVENL